MAEQEAGAKPQAAEREPQTAVAPLNTIVKEDVAAASKAVDDWLRSFSGGYVTLERLTMVLGSIPIVGNIMALVDVFLDIINIVEKKAKDGVDAFLNWVSLGINLIGLIPIPPSMAAARMSLRPTLHLVKQELKTAASNLGEAIVTILVGHLNATIMGELDKFIDGAIAKLDGILKSCADLADKIIDNLVDILRRVLGQKDLFTVGTPAAAETKVHDPKTQSTWSRMWGAAVRYSKQSANYVAKAAASQLPDGVAGRVNGVITQMLDFKQQLRGQLSRLADKEAQASIMWLLHKLRDALLKKKGKRAAIVPPQSGAVAQKDKPGDQLGHISKQAPANGRGCSIKNGPAPVRKGGSISLALGDESFSHTDFVLAAPLPIEWARTYASDLDAFDRGSLGARWITPYSMRVDVTTPTRGARQGQPSLVYHAADGRSHAYPVLAVGQAYFDPIEEVRVSRLSESLLALDFGKPLPQSEQSQWREIYEYVDSRQPHFRLVAQQAKDGMAIGLRYDHVIAATGERVLSDIISKHGEAVMAHVGTKPDAQTGLIQSLWELKDGQVMRQLAGYTHDDERDLVAAQDEDGASWSYTYSHHLVTRYTDRTGRGMNLEYDGTGPDAKAVREWSDDGSFALKLEWDRNIRLTYVTDALGGETWHYYDIQGYTYRIIHPDGLQEWFFRDDAKNITRHVHTDGTTDDYTYDADGNLQTHTRADGSRVHYEYDRLNRLTGIRDAEGGVWKRDYDAQGHLTEEIDPLGHKTEYAYDKAGRPVRITDAKGGTKLMSYTPRGRLASLTDCSGKTSRWTYDDRGRLATAVDPAGNVTRHLYSLPQEDAVLRAQGSVPGLLHEIVLPDGTREQKLHDPEGRMLAHVDGLGRRTHYSYNRAGLIAGRTDAEGNSLRYQWDLLGRLVELHNENGSRHSLRYDPVGRLLEKTDFARRTTRYRYEESTGRLVEVAAGGRVVQLQADAMGRMTERSAGGQVERFAFDRNGRMVEASNNDARLQWFYDPAGNLTREHQHDLQAGRTAIWQHRYDALNQRVATIRPDGHTTQWLTYGSGHVHGLLLDGHDILGFERDDLHREVLREQRNGLTQKLRYDNAGRRLEQQVVPGQASAPGALQLRRTYGYDKAGQLVAIGDSHHGNLDYRYDPVGRLVEANSRFGRETFAFDPVGNIAEPHDEAGASRAPIAPLFDNLLRAYAGVRYRYDEHGNMVERVCNGRSTTFAWDGFGRLSSATDEDGTPTSFAYDPLGRRISKRSRDSITRFGWDGDTLAFESTQSLAAEQEDEGRGWSVHYVHEPRSFAPLVQLRQAHAIVPGRTPDVRELMAANGGAYDIEQDPLWNGELQPGQRSFEADEIAFCQCDHLGTPRDLTDHEGRVGWSAQYKAWGEAREVISEAGRRAGIVNPIRFQGQYFDAETGLHYNRYRYYDPASGRYVSPDPLGLAGGLNLYAYVGGNPVRGIDPLGLVDINLFPHNEAIRQSADNIPSPPGTFTVGSHGNPSIMTDTALKGITPAQMAERIKAHPSYTEGQKVQLMSCETGKGTDPYAQKLANELNAPVVAPDKLLWIWPHGAYKPAGRKADGTMDTADPGVWHTFNPKS
ncbi:RHS repeat-associated protein [Variovorax sp. SG517]|uniref:RHS repeat-associated core domain-containing protein n=1 Tax=Variovorax sp. SG517 TaxID=2587117 RepID=UPI00159D434B|nr:RHS repeat-associated core domain-containing protein [Variovorax sp. SG517]NVM92463.1 RHS repeat-associated protein [Variovorax sp. SG517]